MIKLKKTVLAVIATAVSLYALTGCMHTNIEMTINEDGTGYIQAKTASDKNDISDYEYYDNLYKNYNWLDIETDCNIKQSGLMAKLEFNNAEELGYKLDCLLGNTNINKYIKGTKYLFEYQIDLNIPKETLFISESNKGSFTLKLPKNIDISSTNATSIEETKTNNIIVWKEPFDFIKITYMANSKLNGHSVKTLYIVTMACLSVVCTAIAILIYFKIYKKHKEDT